jgi:integrase
MLLRLPAVIRATVVRRDSAPRSQGIPPLVIGTGTPASRRTRTPSATAGGRPLAADGLTGVELHDLRHFYASGLIASGCDVVTVQRALGHSSATTTLSTYSHLWPSAEDRTRAAAQAMLTESYGPEADRRSTGDR